ncbi:MAG: 3'(2'),5'-bisphosphate nucleotidase CysQ [Bradyrhizobiaceae bacterium]|nr:3'(2'),5'-bisphosphate nucleotidase CysQ [Bradyrhizobiaceae bacterium]
MLGKEKVLLAKEPENAQLTPAEAADVLARAAVEAGELALAMQRKGVRTWNKEHNSPVTEADIAADKILRERLTAAAPDYGWRSEESAGAASFARRWWVVDPIDGTQSFIKGLTDWSVSTALVEDGRPVAAVLFAPATEELFVAVAGQGATRNGTAIEATARQTLAGTRIAGPKLTLERMKRAGIVFTPVPRIHSLALRMVRVASGEIDAALASENSRDWDLAAADLLVHEAGGALTSIAGRRLIYDRPDTEHPALVTAGSGLHPALLAALEGTFAGGAGMQPASQP